MPRAIAIFAALLASVAAASAEPPAPGSAADPATRAERRGLPFWTALAKECDVPAGESASALVGEAVALAGSPDTRWREDVGYEVVAACVYQTRRLTAGERRTLVATLSANLRRGVGEMGTDSVLLRSFSALDLSILAAVEAQDPALDAAGYRRLLDDALAYLRDERDLRGLEPRVGWIHATAHTADLLKFLARDPRLTPADQSRLLEAAFSKMTAPGTAVFTHAEDERLAAAVVSVVRRADFDAAALDRWLERFPALEKEAWSKAPPDVRVLDAAQNARNLLRSLYVILTLPAPSGGAAPAHVGPARERVLGVLEAIRRS